MESDFSTMGRSARALIAVPDVPLDSIRSRSHAARARSRMETFGACAALALAAVGAGTGVGAKIYNEVHVWLSGGKSAVLIHSGVLMRHPMGAELRDAIAGATFPVVFPVGVPAGTRVDMVTVAPIGHPSSITISYQNAAGFKTSFALLDPAVVSADAAQLPTGSVGIAVGPFEHWRVGGEIVLTRSTGASLADLNRIKAAMSTASPGDSLALTETMLPTVTVLGGTVRLGIAERYRPANGRSVLVDENSIRTIPGLVKRGAPLLDSRIDTITNITYKNGDISTGVGRPPKDIAVSAGGVRAIYAVLRSSGVAHGRYFCGCEMLFNQPNRSTYWVWQIPMSASSAVTKYSVDAKTFAVTPLAEGTTGQ